MAITVWFTLCPTSAVENNMLEKQLKPLTYNIYIFIDRITIGIMTESIFAVKAVCKNICLNRYATQ